MTIFKGAATALITPFKNDLIDYVSFERLIEFQIKGGINALVVNGTTGEPTTMTHDERTAALKFVIEKVNKRVPVIAGAGSNNTYTAVEYAVEAEGLGADGILAVTPYYNKCSQAGLIAHYKALNDSVNLPIITYNVPGRTGVNIDPETALKLSELKNIVAIKEASGNINQFMEVARLTRGKLDLISGDDAFIYPIMAIGGIGVISVASNIIPEYISKMTRLYFEGKLNESLEMQLKVNPLVKALFSEVNPIPVKFAATAMGICDSYYMRLPLTPFSKKEYLLDEMRKLGINC